MRKMTSVMGSVALACAASAADAALIDGGNGLVYDSILDITWLQDANLAATNQFGVPLAVLGGIADGVTPYPGSVPAEYPPAGSMSWDTAKDWIAGMNAVGYMGFTGWRLPTLTPIDPIAGFVYDVSFDGSTDRGFNQTSVTNELSHLYYSSLGNFGLCSNVPENITGVTTTENCVQSGKELDPDAPPTWGLMNTGPFDNLIAGRYWTGQENTQDDSRAFDLDTTFGQVGTGGKGGYKYAWAVIDGNVAGLTAVPVPAALWLFGSGLMGLVAVARRRGAK